MTGPRENEHGANLTKPVRLLQLQTMMVNNDGEYTITKASTLFLFIPTIVAGNVGAKIRRVSQRVVHRHNTMATTASREDREKH